ncbi:hypothetical protein ABVT39_004215 [Epinephelus coioides]
MEMWLTRSTLVVLLTAAAVLVISGQAPVILDETIREERIPSGSSLTFHCRLRTENHSRLRVVWYFKQSLVSDSHTILHTEVVNKSARTSTVASNKPKQDLKDEGRDTEETLSVYTLSNATEENSGWYFCEVIIEIPLLTKKMSNGTEVVISTVSPTDAPPIIDLWMWIILGVSAFILIVLLVTCICLRRRWRRKRGEDPVYANTRPRQPSPRPGMDNLKTVPSSQHLRNPSPSRTYDDGKRRYKHRKCDGTSQTSKPAHHHV